MTNIDELKKAVLENNVEEINHLLTEGADVNSIIEFEEMLEEPWHSKKSTFLHITDSVEITKQLLLHGASVNAKNDYGATPLHYAIHRRKPITLIRELLKNGADANAKLQCLEVSPLQIAVRENPENLEVIEALLKYGAGADTQLFVDYRNVLPMVDSMADLECAKLLIKYDLLQNYNTKYKGVSHFDCYDGTRFHNEIQSYLQDCIGEIGRMTFHSLGCLSLFQLIWFPSKKFVMAYVKKKNIMPQMLSIKYPIYLDIILDKLHLKRIFLLSKLKVIKIYIFHSGKKTYVNHNCSNHIAKYLSDDDLDNFIKAFE